jgi:RNA polymerase nonessential primary-like sigma factor
VAESRLYWPKWFTTPLEMDHRGWVFNLIPVPGLRPVNNTKTNPKMSSQSFTAYLTDIAEIPLLTAQQEKELGTIIQTQPQSPEADEARSKLISANLKLVVSIATQYGNSKLTVEEMTSEGNIGLMTAVNRFDPIRFTNRFSTYATLWIRQAIRVAVNRAHIIRIPVRCSARLQKILQSASYCEDAADQDIGRIARETQLPAHSVRYCLANRYRVASLDRALADSDETIESTILDDRETDPTDQEDANRALEAIPLCLSELETDVIKRRFGIGCPVHTLEHLTRIHPVGREHLRRIEKQALKTLHAYLESNTIPPRPQKRCSGEAKARCNVLIGREPRPASKSRRLTKIPRAKRSERLMQSGAGTNTKTNTKRLYFDAVG